MWGELSSEWGELSSECGARCLGASFLWGELSWGKLSLGRVVRNPIEMTLNCYERFEQVRNVLNVVQAFTFFIRGCPNVKDRCKQLSRMADVKKFPESVVEQIDSADTVCSECFSIYDKDRYDAFIRRSCRIKRIHHWCSVGTGKSQPEGPPFQWETRISRFHCTHI